MMGKIRGIFWPIYGKENILFGVLSSLVVLLSFMIEICASMKDGLVINVFNGAASITFLKVYGVLPLSLVAFIFIAWASQRWGRHSLFYILVVPFLVYLAVHAFLIYPQIQALHGPEANPTGSPWLDIIKSIFQFWPESLFYVMTDLFRNILVVFLVWQIANDSVTVEQAKRLYPYILIIFALFNMLSTTILSWLIHAFASDYDLYVKIALSMAMLAGAVALFIYHSWRKNLVHLAIHSIPGVSVLRIMKTTLASRHFLLIGLMVICFRMATNSYENMWRNTVRSALENASKSSLDVTSYLFPNNTLLFILFLFFASVFLRYLSWKSNAATIAVLLCTFGVLSCFVVDSETITYFVVLLMAFPRWIGVPFQPIKNIAFVASDFDSRLTSKAGVDLLSGPIAALISLSAQALGILDDPFSMAALFVLVALVWMGSIFGLARSMRTLS